MRRSASQRPGPRSPLAGLAAAAAVVLALLGAPGGLAAQGPGAPGPELFAKAPETPLELWDAVDYLVRVGRPDQAVPYLQAFLQADPPDDVLLQIRDRYGVGSFLALEDHPETRPYVPALLEKVNAAARRRAADPQRIRRFVAALTATREEQEYALDQLRAAGPDAVPYILEALASPALSEADRALIAANLGRLDRTAVPALVAALDAPDARLAADVADALGRIGERSAVPSLTYPAAQDRQLILRDPAQRAIARITGRPFAAQPRPPVRVLTDAARAYLTHAVAFPGPGDTVRIWTWEPGAGLAARTVPRGAAEGYFGLKFARQALALDPSDHEAQVLDVALALQHAAARSGVVGFVNDPSGAYPTALVAGPAVLGDVLRLALAEGLPDLSAPAATALGRVAARDALVVADGRYHPLVEALASPDRRTRFAAAQALVQLDPRGTFPGASRVVPALAQFVLAGPQPRAVVIDGDANRGNQVAAVLRGLGYDAAVATGGKEGFRLAAASADVELVMIRPAILEGAWGTLDTLTNLRADPATAGVPILLYGPLTMRNLVRDPIRNDPAIRFTVEPTDPRHFGPILTRELERIGIRPLAPEERQAYAQAAAGLLAAVALRPGSPFEPDVAGVEPALVESLANPITAPAATLALSDVPDGDAQRQLAGAVLDTAQPADRRLAAADALTRSIQRFGPLLGDPLERSLLQARDGAADPALRAALSGIIGALRPAPAVVAPRLRALEPESLLPAPAAGAPAGAPAPPAPPAPPAAPGA